MSQSTDEEKYRGKFINNKSVLALSHTFEVTLSLCAVCKQLLFDLDAELAVTMFNTQSEPYLLQQQLLSTSYLEVGIILHDYCGEKTP